MKTSFSKRYLQSVLATKNNLNKILYTKEFLDFIEITGDSRKGEVCLYRIYKKDGKVVMG